MVFHGRVWKIALSLFLLMVRGLLAEDTDRRLWGGVSYGLEASDRPPAPGSPSWSALQTLSLALHFQYKSDLSLVSELSTHLDAAAPPSWDRVIGQLFLTFHPTAYLSLSVGRQRQSWGSARIFAAVDKLDPVANALSATPALSGVSGVKAVLIPNEWLSLSGLFMPEADLRWSRAAFKADVLVLGEIDLGVGAIKYNFTHRTASGSGFGAELWDRWAFLADGAWFWDRFGFFGEMLWRPSRDKEYSINGSSLTGGLDSPVLRAAGGIQMSLPSWNDFPEMTLLAEYFYNQDGFDPGEARAFANLYKPNRNSPGLVLPSRIGHFGEFRQHYAYVGLSDVPLTEELGLSSSVSVNLETWSGRLSIGAGWTIDKRVRVNIGWERFGSLRGEEELSELLFFDERNLIRLSVNSGF